MKALSLRLSFLLLALLATLAQAGDDAVRVRVAAANISSGRNQTYDPGHGMRIFQAAKPDIVAIQEFNYGGNSPEAIRKFVDDTFGKDFHYYRETKPGLHIPNGIISRYPIVEAGSWPDPIIRDRGFAWAKIRLPTGEHMWVVSVHLSTKSTMNRQIEADALVEQIKKNIPEKAMLVIAGDFNTKSEREKALDILKEVAGESHSPRGADGRTTTNATRSKRYDWVLASPGLDRLHAAVELEAGEGTERKEGVHTFPEGLVFDTRVMRDHLPSPARRDDSAAENMQHMMVIKDFVIPKPKPHVEEKREPGDGGNPTH